MAKINVKQMLQALVVALAVIIVTPIVTNTLGGIALFNMLAIQIPMTTVTILTGLVGGAVAFGAMLLINKYWS